MAPLIFHSEEVKNKLNEIYKIFVQNHQNYENLMTLMSENLYLYQILLIEDLQEKHEKINE